MLSGDVDISKSLNDCKDYILTACQSNRFNEKLDELIQVGTHTLNGLIYEVSL